MKRDEAEKLVAAEGSSKDTVDGLLTMFTRDIEEYTKEDFIDGTEPYDYLYLYKNDPFTLERKRQKLEIVARKCGVRNFSKLFKEYCLNKGSDIGGLNVTGFPDQPVSLRCGNYICDQSGVHTDTETICPHPIMPVQRMCNVDTGVEKIKIAFTKGKGWRTAIFDRKTIFTTNRITDMADIGVAVTSESAKGLVKYFAKLEELNTDIIEETECVTRMGWITVEDEVKFVPYVDSLVFDGEASYRKYYENVKSKGNLEKWISFINENIRKGSVIARVVFSAALASALIKPLGCLPFFIHLWGETESAKSVLAMCAASIWANPEIGQYIQTFNSTLVGMEKSAAFYNNLPLMLDELQIVNERKDFEKEIYMLTEGTGKTRGNKNGGVDITPTWKNCIITTGEKPILSGNSGGGAVNRVIEVECKEKFFKDPRAVANFVKSNYGYLGKAFIGKLKHDGFDEAEQVFTAYYNELVNDYDIMQKQASSAALILTADKLVTDMCFESGTNLTAEEISEFLKTKTAVSVNPRAYEYVCEYVAANQNKFLGSSEYGEVWGVMDGDSVYILKSKFMQICSEGGFNAQSLLSWLSGRKLIRRTDGKNYAVLKRVGSAVVRCVHMMLSTESEPGDDDEDNITL